VFVQLHLQLLERGNDSLYRIFFFPAYRNSWNLWNLDRARKSKNPDGVGRFHKLSLDRHFRRQISPEMFRPRKIDCASVLSHSESLHRRSQGSNVGPGSRHQQLTSKNVSSIIFPNTTRPVIKSSLSVPPGLAPNQTKLCVKVKPKYFKKKYFNLLYPHPFFLSK